MTYKIKASFLHVKGHQDDHEDYDNLPLIAQLNIDADLLTQRFYKEGTPSTFQAPLLPACPAILVIRGVTITNDYPKYLQRAYTEPRYISYLQDKYQWTDATTEWIAWKSLSCGICRIQRPSLITKICNDLLPTATILKKWKYQAHDYCSLCGLPETNAHIYICCHNSRIKWRRALLKDVRTTLQSLKTKNSITETFSTALSEWFDTGQVDIDKYPSVHHEALYTQTRIGWRQVLLGRLSQGWERLQGPTHLQHGRQRTPYLWAANLVETLLRKSIELWELRNQDVHGHNDQDRARLRRIRLQNTVNTLIALKDKCLPDQHLLFPEAPSELLEAQNQDLESWILSRKPIIMKSIKQARKNTKANHSSITQWFRPITTPRLKQRPNWKLDRLLFEPYSKKKKNRNLGRQTSITKFVTLLPPP